MDNALDSKDGLTPSVREIPRILLSAGSSSSGKTTVTIGLLAALTEAGYKVQPFKVGLDYIDPSYYTDITGRRARNLDGFLMDEESIRDVFINGCEADGDADIAIIEGVRGLFEGFDSFTDTGSTAQIAKILRCSVILIINARSITRSAAALVNGFKDFDKDVHIAGVILNNIGGPRHAQKAKEAIEFYTGIPVIGIIHRNNSMQISMRHLGLVPAIEERRRSEDFEGRITFIRDTIKEGVDIPRLLDMAHNAKPLERPISSMFCNTGHDEKRPVIGVALDEAFNFYYHDNLELLQLAGADIKYFSPLNDRALPDVDGLFIGGGYPELFAARLEANEDMREDIREASLSGLPIYAECGGLMYLTEKLSTGIGSADNCETTTHEMVGALPGHSSPGRRRIVSYNIGSFTMDTPIGKAGNSFRGHEFHHSEIIDLPADARFSIKLSRGTGILDAKDGLMANNTMGCYAHQMASSYKEFAESFLAFVRSNMDD